MFLDEAGVVDKPGSRLEAEETAGVKARGRLDVDRTLADSPELKEIVEAVMMVDGPEKTTVLDGAAGSPEPDSEDEAVAEPLIRVDAGPKDMLTDDETTDDNPDVGIVAEDIRDFNTEANVDVV